MTVAHTDSKNRIAKGKRATVRQEVKQIMKNESGIDSVRDDSCESQPYQWVCVTEEADFVWRDGAGALVFKDKMWLLGGWRFEDQPPHAHSCNSEVWSSTDGAAWVLTNAKAPWECRHCAGYVVHNEMMWIVGGDTNQGHYQNDVWNSSDGVHWNLVNNNVPWAPRALHHTLCFDNKIWVMGGQASPPIADPPDVFYNDVWSSCDGVSWMQVTDKAPWPPRGMVGGNVVFNGRMWLLGGGTYETPQTPKRKCYNDVWSSADGENWQQHTESAPWDARHYHDVAVFDDKMWVMEGCISRHDERQDLPIGNRRDVWYSTDGVNWCELPDTPWEPRHAASVFVYDDSLWMVAGNSMTRDAWKLVRRGK